MSNNLLTIAAAAKRLGMTTAGLQLLVRIKAVPCHNGRVTLRRVRAAEMTLANATCVFGYVDGSRILWRRVDEGKLKLANPGGRPMLVTVAEMLRYLESQTLRTRGKMIVDWG